MEGKPNKNGYYKITYKVKADKDRYYRLRGKNLGTDVEGYSSLKFYIHISLSIIFKKFIVLNLSFLWRFLPIKDKVTYFIRVLNLFVFHSNEIKLQVIM